MATMTEAKTFDVKRTIDVTPTAHGQTEALAAHAAPAASGFTRAAEDAAHFSRDTAAAMTQAGQATIAGMQELSRQLATALQAMTEQAIETGRALASVKSLQEATELQTRYARTAFDHAVAEQGKLQATLVKLSETTFAPFTARMQAAMAQAAKPFGG